MNFYIMEKSKEWHSNVLQSLIDAGYGSIEVNFTVVSKRSGLAGLLEKYGWLKKKRVGFSIMVKSIDNIAVLSSGEDNFVTLKNVNMCGLH